MDSGPRATAGRQGLRRVLRSEISKLARHVKRKAHTRGSL